MARQLENPRHLQGAVSEVAFHLVKAGRFADAFGVIEPAQEQARLHDSLGFLNMGCLHGETLYQAGRFRASAQVSDAARRQLPDLRLYPAYWVFSCWNLGLPLEALGRWEEVSALQEEARQAHASETGAATLLTWWEGDFACTTGNWTTAVERAKELRAELVDSKDDPWYLADIRTRELEAQIAASRGAYDVAHERVCILTDVAHAEYLGEYWPLAQIAASIEADRTVSGHAAATPGDEFLQPSPLWSTPHRSLLPGPTPPSTADLVQRPATMDPTSGRGSSTRGETSSTSPTSAGPCSGSPTRTPAAVTRSRSPTHWPRLGTSPSAWGAAPLQDRVVDLSLRTRTKLGPQQPAAKGALHGPLARLTDRELEVLRHIAAGESNDEIASSPLYLPQDHLSARLPHPVQARRAPAARRPPRSPTSTESSASKEVTDPDSRPTPRPADGTLDDGPGHQARRPRRRTGTARRRGRPRTRRSPHDRPHRGRRRPREVPSLSESLTAHSDTKDVIAITSGLELAGDELPWGATTEAAPRTLVTPAGVAPSSTPPGKRAPTSHPLCPALRTDGLGDRDVCHVRLLPAIGATAQNLATDRLVWLAVEDLHWVDPHSRDRSPTYCGSLHRVIWSRLSPSALTTQPPAPRQTP